MTIETRSYHSGAYNDLEFIEIRNDFPDQYINVNLSEAIALNGELAAIIADALENGEVAA